MSRSAVSDTARSALSDLLLSYSSCRAVLRHGLRASEIADLEWSQVELGRNAMLKAVGPSAPR
jgi:integrase